MSQQKNRRLKMIFCSQRYTQLQNHFTAAMAHSDLILDFIDGLPPESQLTYPMTLNAVALLRAGDKELNRLYDTLAVMHPTTVPHSGLTKYSKEVEYYCEKTHVNSLQLTKHQVYFLVNRLCTEAAQTRQVLIQLYEELKSGD